MPDQVRRHYAEVQAEALRHFEPATPEEPSPQQEEPTPQVPTPPVPPPQLPAPDNGASTSQPDTRPETPATITSVTSGMEAISVQDSVVHGSAVDRLELPVDEPGIPVSKNPFDALMYFSAP